MRKILKTAVLSFCLCFLDSTSAVCQKTDTQKGTFAKIKQEKVLKVCSEAGYLPLEMKSASGTWIGFDVDMMQAYADSIGVKLQMMDTKWDGIIPSLLSKKCDMIASAMAMTEERKKVVDFSDSYFSNEFLIAMLKTKENEKNFKSVSDLNRADLQRDQGSLRIAVKTGSSPDLYLQANPTVLKTAKILKYDADADTISAVLNKRADAFIYDTPYVKLAALNYPGKLYVLPEGFGGDNFGVAIRKDDKDLLCDFNEFLKNWKRVEKYDKKNKKYEKMRSYEETYKYYFKGTTWRPMLEK